MSYTKRKDRALSNLDRANAMLRDAGSTRQFILGFQGEPTYALVGIKFIGQDTVSSVMGMSVENAELFFEGALYALEVCQSEHVCFRGQTSS